MLKPVLERFLDKISISPSGCWEWDKCLTKGGYGQIRIKGKTEYTHRFVFAYYHGELNPNLTINHKCRNRRCCNVNHLEEITNEENLRIGLHKNQNSNKTHCNNGHEFTKENTYIRPNGARNCRVCQRIKQRAN